jgi:hypothetical protein
MKYAVQMGPGAMIYILSFIQIGPRTQELIRGTHIETCRRTGTQTARRSHKPLLFFSKQAEQVNKNGTKGKDVPVLN